MSIASVGTGVQAARTGGVAASEPCAGQEAYLLRSPKTNRCGTDILPVICRLESPCHTDVLEALSVSGNAVPFAAEEEGLGETVRRLREKLENHHRRRVRRAGWTRRFIPTGVVPLDAALPYGGLPCGAITEILSDYCGVGAMSLSMRIASRCIGQIESPISKEMGHPTQDDHRRLVLVDTMKDLYPPAAWQHGISPDRLIVIHPSCQRDAFWAVDQSLRCGAVAAVIALLTQLDERRSRRLQLAAESSGCLGLILRPARGRVKSFAAVRMLIESVPRAGTACRITLLTVREGMPTEPIRVDLYHETGTVPLHPLPVDRSTARTG